MTDNDEIVPLRDAKHRALSPSPSKPGHQPSILEITDPVALEGKPVPERRWVVERWIPHGSVTLLGGDGGLGKSLLVQMLATAAAADVPWLGMRVAHMKSLCIFCEDDSDEIHRRQVAINRHHKLDFADLTGTSWQSRIVEDNALVDYRVIESGVRGRLEPTVLYHSIRRYVGDNGIQLLILDSLHDLFPGNENSRPEVRRFTQYLARIALNMDGAVILTAHPSVSGLASGSGLSGSTAWNNAVRSRLYLTRPPQDEDAGPDEDARVLSCKKSNYARANETMKLRWCDGIFTRENLAESGGFIDSRDKATRECEIKEMFLLALDKLTKQGRHVNSHKNQQNYAPKVMKTLTDFNGCGRREIEHAMNRLFEKGKIRIAQAGPPSRPRSFIARATKDAEP